MQHVGHDMSEEARHHRSRHPRRVDSSAPAAGSHTHYKQMHHNKVAAQADLLSAGKELEGGPLPRGDDESDSGFSLELLENDKD